MAIDDVLEISIDDIKIKKRIRSDEASFGELEESIKKYGLLQPIVIDNKMRLIAGYRRLKVCKKLGMDKVLARIVNVDSDEDFLLLEMEENICRLSFSEEELKEAKRRLEKIRHPNFFVWLWRKIKSFFIG